MTLNYQLVKEKRIKLNFPSDLFISGSYHKSISEKSFDNISPIDGKIINQISFAQQDDIDRAVDSARKVFEKGHWSNMPPGQRKKILLKFAQLIERDRLELSLLDTIDMGKTIGEAFMLMYYLDRACKVQIDLLNIKKEVIKPSKNLLEFAAGQYNDPKYQLGKHEWPALKRMLDKNNSIYDQ